MSLTVLNTEILSRLREGSKAKTVEEVLDTFFFLKSTLEVIFESNDKKEGKASLICENLTRLIVSLRHADASQLTSTDVDKSKSQSLLFCMAEMWMIIKKDYEIGPLEFITRLDKQKLDLGKIRQEIHMYNLLHTLYEYILIFPEDEIIEAFPKASCSSTKIIDSLEEQLIKEGRIKIHGIEGDLLICHTHNYFYEGYVDDSLTKDYTKLRNSLLKINKTDKLCWKFNIPTNTVEMKKSPLTILIKGCTWDRFCKVIESFEINLIAMTDITLNNIEFIFTFVTAALFQLLKFEKNKKERCPKYAIPDLIEKIRRVFKKVTVQSLCKHYEENLLPLLLNIRYVLTIFRNQRELLKIQANIFESYLERVFILHKKISGKEPFALHMNLDIHLKNSQHSSSINPDIILYDNMDLWLKKFSETTNQQEILQNATEKECVICFLELSDNAADIAVLPECNHVSCLPCAKSWFGPISKSKE